MLHEVGAHPHAHAVIFDGASKNVGMAEKLGCNIKNLDGLFLIHVIMREGFMLFLTFVK